MPYDPIAALASGLAADRRPPDGLLHCSGDLIGSLRHAMLTAAGAPTIDRTIADSMPLILGTLMHRWLEGTMRGAPIMQEVNLTPWMPEGWTGTADAFVWDDEIRGFTLLDFKTQSPDSFGYLRKEGIKAEHLHQLTAYWWAAVTAGLPMVETIGVLYIPKGRARHGAVEPLYLEAKPFSEEYMLGIMEHRWRLTQAYFKSFAGRTFYADSRPETWLTDALAPVQERVQVLMKEKDGKRDLMLMPHWGAAYCPFPDVLCDCSTTGNTKIGHWWYDDTIPGWAYQARKGYDDIKPEEAP